MLHLDQQHLAPFLADAEFARIRPQVEAAHRALLDGTGPSADLTGWRTLLTQPDYGVIEEVEALAAEIRERADVLVCIGIGGSYLGAQAVIDALSPYFGRKGPEVLFAGHHLSEAYLQQLLAYLEGKRVYINVISKSGTTLEPAVAFRFLRRWLEAHADDADRRTIITTSPEGGALNHIGQERGYRKLVLPEGIGGRFSVLTPVGLLPIAAAGLDARALFEGAADAAGRYAEVRANPALDYAASRHLLHTRGYTTELLAVFEPRLRGVGFWWQQLFGESEGKEGKGLFPVSVQYTTDLHSLGQYVQEGKRVLAETFLLAGTAAGALAVERSADNADGLDYLTGKSVTEIEGAAYGATAQAHADGGVPNQTVRLDAPDAPHIGEAIYFFEHAVAVGGYVLGVDPFDQPGVEAYKKEMFRRLGRP